VTDPAPKKLPTTITLSPEVLSTPIGDSLMLLDLASGVYYELEGAGSRIWQMLVEETAPAEVARLISREYGISEANAADDLFDLLYELSASGLIFYDGGPPPQPAKSESTDE